MGLKQFRFFNKQIRRLNMENEVGYMKIRLDDSRISPYANEILQQLPDGFTFKGITNVFNCNSNIVKTLFKMFKFEELNPEINFDIIPCTDSINSADTFIFKILSSREREDVIHIEQHNKIAMDSTYVCIKANLKNIKKEYKDCIIPEDEF